MPQSGVGLAAGQIELVDAGTGPEGLQHGVAPFDDAVGLGLGLHPALLHGLSRLSLCDNGNSIPQDGVQKKPKMRL